MPKEIIVITPEGADTILREITSSYNISNSDLMARLVILQTEILISVLDRLDGLEVKIKANRW